MTVSKVMLAYIRELRVRAREPVVAWDCMFAQPMATHLESLRRKLRDKSDKDAIKHLKAEQRRINRKNGGGGWGWYLRMDYTSQIDKIIANHAAGVN